MSGALRLERNQHTQRGIVKNMLVFKWSSTKVKVITNWILEVRCL